MATSPELISPPTGMVVGKTKTTEAVAAVGAPTDLKKSDLVIGAQFLNYTNRKDQLKLQVKDEVKAEFRTPKKIHPSRLFSIGDISGERFKLVIKKSKGPSRVISRS